MNEKASIIKEFWHFIRAKKLWWIFPAVVFLVLVGALLVTAQGSALAPLIYTIF